MPAQSIEQRLSSIETELSQIKETLGTIRPADPWWRRIVGVYQDDPAFDESERLGREWRESSRPAGEEPAPL